jgi:predicted ATPase
MFQTGAMFPVPFRPGSVYRSTQMIQSIQIQGYRSLRDVTWNPGKLNLVIGPNASGKSNLLRALALLQDSAAPGRRLSAEIEGEGGMGAILWDGRTERLRWSLQTEPVQIRGRRVGT